jgi:hypothetical protein
MSKNFNVFRQVALGYILIVGLSVGLITPIVQAEAPTGSSYNSSTEPVLVDGLTQAERAAKIDKFFTDRGNLPLAGYGITFVALADKYNVDWKLVPTLSYLESTAGEHECPPKNGVKTYNAFGYRGCNTVFKSYEDAIDTVTRNIAGEIASTAKYYKDKTTVQKIEAYNPKEYNPNYQGLAKYVMNKIATTNTEMIASNATASHKELAMNK